MNFYNLFVLQMQTPYQLRYGYPIPIDSYSQQYMGWNPHGFFPHFPAFPDYSQVPNTNTSTHPNVCVPNIGHYTMPPAIDGPFQPAVDSQRQSGSDSDRTMPQGLDGQIDSPISDNQDKEFDTFSEVCKLPTTEMSSSKFFLEPDERVKPGPMRPRGKDKRSKLSKEKKKDQVKTTALEGPQPPMTPIMGNEIWTPQTPDHNVLKTSSPQRKTKDNFAEGE